MLKKDDEEPTKELYRRLVGGSELERRKTW